MEYIFLFMLVFSATSSTIEKPDILIKSWKQDPQGKKKFIMTNHKREKLTEGYLEWNLEKNIWIFHYENSIITIQNNEVSKKEKGILKKYKCFGFSKIFANPIEKWHEAMPFDNEIEMDNICYTQFKTNKSYIIYHFQIHPFKLIRITFGENGEDYILFFEE